MTNKTFFGRVAIGEKFTAPSETIEYRKTGERLATRLRDGRVFTVGLGMEVVPECDATIGDILGSWKGL